MNGVPQDPIDGVSFAKTFAGSQRRAPAATRYFEIMGSRAIYHDGWMASAFGPRTPGFPVGLPGIHEWSPDNDVWELYNLKEVVPGEKMQPRIREIAQMKELFLIEATKNKALPVGGGLWVPILHPELR